MLVVCNESRKYFHLFLTYYTTLYRFLGSWFLLFTAENDRQIFVWLTSVIDAFLFLVGSAYYVAGDIKQTLFPQ